MPPSPDSRITLNQLLQMRNEHPEKAPEIDQAIYARFEQQCAILVLDLSGFSRLTIRHGIIHFLAMIHRMTAIATPLINQHGGTLVKQEADNLFAIFADVQTAVDTAVDILKAFAAVNTGLPEEHDLHAGIGIGYGKTLVLGNEDLYGCEMNLACKLGEDLARRGEILLTEAAIKQVEFQTDTWDELLLTVSGLELIAYKLKTTPDWDGSRYPV